MSSVLVPVQVVDGVAPVVLDVPAEGGEAHAHVEPGQRHAADVGGDMSQHRRVHHRHVVEVPATLEVFLTARKHAYLWHGKYLIGRQRIMRQLWAGPLTSSAGDTLKRPLGMGNPLPNSLEAMSAPYSTVTSSSMAPTSRQNSFSTSSVGTICPQTQQRNRNALRGRFQPQNKKKQKQIKSNLLLTCTGMLK